MFAMISKPMYYIFIFVPTIEGVGMRISVNYRSVLQSNYFEQIDSRKVTFFQAVYEADGDTSKQSSKAGILCCDPYW
jgi:hypothetical protein